MADKKLSLNMDDIGILLGMVLSMDPNASFHYLNGEVAHTELALFHRVRAAAQIDDGKYVFDFELYQE